ncbi:MAG: phosphoheptose isomerase [Rhodospirillales bacterium CG15_BIG_FIL_POST_REV_8_21_14_020_66_15]|nr:MAG: phosphoheptose isomerase [Rhodospirillales bacterium CG15_BIG_FIL_POST_REV_8_21_14_020_66_15]
MDLQAFFESEMEEHAAVARATRAGLRAPFQALVEVSAKSLKQGGKLLFFGNGGSAADCQHLATELTVRYKTDRAPIAAIALTTDSSALTAGGNDLGFEQIFARQVRALGRPGDVAIGISTSGESPNVLQALRAAAECGLVAAGLAGKGGGAMAGLADPLLVVPSDVTARIQEMHITLGQMLCGALEVELGLVAADG